MYLANEPSTSLGLNSTIKRTKLIHNNVLMKKLMNVTLNLSIYNTICFFFTYVKLHLHRLEIKTYKFVNKSISSAGLTLNAIDAIA